MGKTGLIIQNDYVEYIERPIGITGTIRKTKAFKIPLHEIKIIAVTAIVLIDDEDFLVSLIDSKGNEFKFSSLEFETEASEIIMDKFWMNSEELWNFTYEQHCTYTNRVFYLIELRGISLYNDNFKSFKVWLNRIKYVLGISKRVMYSREINDYLNIKT